MYAEGVTLPSGRERLSLRPEPEAAADLFEALVTRSDATGVWVVPEGGNPNSPIGPCAGGTRVALGTVSGGGTSHAHALTVERLPEKTRVLVALTRWGPWIVRDDRAAT